MTDKRREVLADYLDQRVIIRGAYERMSVNKNPHKPFKVALLQDVEVELPEGKFDLGHMWVQHAETLANLHYGDRIQCECRVGRYRKSITVGDNGTGERVDYSLSWPNEIKLLTRPVALSHTSQDTNHTPAPPLSPPLSAPRPEPPVKVEEPAKASDPIQLMLQVKELVEKVGGLERIQELNGLIDRLGGWERVVEIHGMAEELGGWDRLGQLLSLMKL